MKKDRFKLVLFLLLFSWTLLCDVSGLTLDTEGHVIVPKGTSHTIRFSYIFGYNLTTYVVIDADSDVRIDGNITENNKTGEVTLLPEHLVLIPYGSYILHLYLEGPNIRETKQLTMFYEETITGVSGKHVPSVVLLNRTSPLCINLTTGSNVNAELLIDNGEVLTTSCNGIVREVCTSVTLKDLRNYNVTVSITNTLSVSIEIIQVEVVRPVQGFNVSYQNNTVLTTKDGPVLFLVTLDSLDRLPIGTVAFQLSYNSVLVLFMDLDVNKLVNDSFHVNYQHMLQGDFVVDASIVSLVDSQHFTFNLSIWNKIVFPAIKSLVGTGENIFKGDYDMESQKYEYIIDFGNGEVDRNKPGILQFGRPSPWLYNYTTAAKYVINISAWNPIYTNLKTHSITVMNPIPPLSIEPAPQNVNYFPLTAQGATFTINMISNNPTPSDLFCVFVFEIGLSSINLSVSITFGVPFKTNHVYSSQGEKSITVICTNPINSITLKTKVYILPAIAGFELSGIDHNVIFFNKISFQSFGFLFTDGYGMNVSGFIVVKQLIAVDIIFFPVEKRGVVSVSPELLSNLTYGTYKMVIELRSISGEVQQKELALFYEEPLDDFQVNQYDNLNLVMTNVEFEATFTSGSSPEIELLFEGTDSLLVKEIGITRHMLFDYVFNTPLIYNVTSLSRNSNGNLFVSNLRVEVIYHVLGLSVEMPTDLINSFTSMTFIARLDSENRLPMGIVNLTMDYGDGHKDIITINDKFGALLSSGGYSITHLYTIQGEKDVSIKFQAEISEFEMNLTAKIWDDITNVKLASPWAVKVNEIVSFNFTNMLASGFQYVIWYGDGGQEVSSANVLFEKFNESSKYHSYSKIGIYDVKLSVSNLYYNKFYQYNITVQYPIPPLQLSPQPPYMIPLPNGIITYSIDMKTNNESPTNVTCLFEFEASHPAVNETVVYIYGKSVTKQYIYTTGGVKKVIITCVNFVSRVILLTVIQVQPVVLDDYTFEYPHIVPMNITSNGIQIPVQVDFTVHLFACVRFSPNVSFTWDFVDGTEKTITYDKNHSHVYNFRGRYNITVSIQDIYSNVTKVLPIKIGAVDFKLERYIGDVGMAIFRYTMTGIGFGGSYDIHVSAREIVHYNPNNSMDVIVHDHTYMYYIREVRPYIIAKNSNYTEILYYDQLVKVDFNLSILSFSIDERTYFPPGDVTVRTFLTDDRSSSLPFVTCRYDMGDYIDFNIYEKTQNISFDEPLLFNYQYKVLGNLTAKVVCHNNYDTFSYTSIVESFNDCFTVNGIFDRQYSNKSNPMKVYTSVDVDLASRMAIYCADLKIEFDWEIYTLDENNEMLSYNYTPVVAPRGIFRFAKGSIPEGLYMVGLNVTILGKTWIWEPTFIEFIRPAPYVYIEGGSERYAKIWRSNLTIDAMKSSYDVSLGYGANSDLEFKWSCKLIQARDLYELSVNFKNSANGMGDCLNLLSTVSTGVSVLTLLKVETTGYAVTVNVTLMNTSTQLSATFTQLIMGISNSAPDVEIQCIVLNCGLKYATMSKSRWKAICLDCDDSYNTLMYEWKLSRLDKTSGLFVPENYLAEITATGIENQELVIKENTLRENSHYILSVIVKRMVEGTDVADTTEARAEFYTNMPPYDGVCRASNQSATGRAVKNIMSLGNAIPSGIASKTMFAIFCNDWKDEGLEIDQDAKRDAKQKNPLTYEYLLLRNRTNDGGNIVTDISSIYKGGESTASELILPEGEMQFNFTVQVQVHVFDRFGDYSSIILPLTVYPNKENKITSDDDSIGTKRMLNTFDDNYAMTEAGGNDMAVFRLITSTASFYNKIKFQNSTIKADTSSLASVVSYDDNTQSEVQNVLQQRTTDLVSKISNKVPGNSSLTIRPADIRLIATTIDSCISNVDVMSENTSSEVSNIAYNLIQNVQKESMVRPFSLTDFEDIEKATSDVIGVLSGNVDFLSQTSAENLNKTLTRETVVEELHEYYRYHPEGIDGYSSVTEELINVIFEKKQKIRDRQKRISENSKSSISKLFGALDLALNVTSSTTAFREGEKTILQKNLNVSIEKDSPDVFLNRTEIKRDGFVLELTNNSLENVTAQQMELQVSVFKKSPIVHANGNSQIKGRIIGLSMRDENAEKIELPVTMKIQNEGTAFFSEYKATADTKIEFITPLQDGNDAVLIYLYPDGFDESNIGLYNYTVYVKSKVSPSDNDFDFKTLITPQVWTSFGFKVFVPGGTLEEGNIIVAVNSVQDKIKNDAKTENVRKKRSTLDFNSTTPDSLNQTLLTNLSVAIVTTGCRVFDSNTQSWIPNGCSVLPFSSLNETVCRCPPGLGSFFASSFVTPNVIDFNTVFSKFDPSNAAVYATMIGILIIYVIGIIYLRKKDKADLIKWTPYLLWDQKGGDDYFYLISVHTGLRPSAGTKSNVYFLLAGEIHDTGVRLLSNGHTKGFMTGSACSFVMSTRRCLGDLSYIRIWHDNSGDGKDCSWYLHKIVVRDLQTEDCFVFLCDNWFALDIGDGMIERILPAMSRTNLEFETLLSQHTRLNVTETHLWLSLLLRPQKSAFTRVQRLSCIVALLFLTMITNAMFFQPEEEETAVADSVRLGPLRLSLRTVYVSVVGALITVVPLSIVTYLFRNRKEKLKPNQHRTKDVINRENELPSIKMIESGKLPYWVLYIAWLIVILAVTSSAFFLLLYSMQWGKEISNEWLTSFFLSFLESILVVDPFKVLLLVILIAFITRRPVEGDEVLVDLDSVRTTSKLQVDSSNLSNDFEDMRMIVLNAGEPLPANMLKLKRQQLNKENAAKRAFISLILQIMFAALVFSISYMNRDERAFHLKTNVENNLYTSTNDLFGFEKVSSQQTFVKWLNETLVPMFYPTSAFNGGSISVRDRFFITDMTNVRVGLVRMRQLRVHKATCYGEFIVRGHFCGRMYDSDSESKDVFCQDCSKLWTTPDVWQHTSANQVWGVDLVGTYNTYAGGGYIVNFDNEKLRTQKVIKELVENSWIDRLTRAAIVEFTLYNPNINMLIYSIFIAEFSEVGGAFTFFDAQCFRPTQLTDATGAFSIICYVIFIIITITTSINWFLKIKKGKCKACKEFWNMVDFILFVCSYVAIAIWVCKYIITKRALQIYYDDKEKFVNFQHIIVWEYIYNCIMGVLCFVSTLRLLKVLGYNKRLTEIAAVLRLGGSEMLKFSMFFFYLFIGFVILGYLLFGQVYEWRNFLASFGSLTNTLIGRNSLDSMISAAPNFAEVFFFVFVFLMIFTLVTMFLATLNKAIEDVRKSRSRREETLGIVDIVKGTLRDILQLFGIHLTKKNGTAPAKKYQVTKTKKKVDTLNVVRLIRETLETTPEDPNNLQNSHANSTNSQISVNVDQKNGRKTERYLKRSLSSKTNRIQEFHQNHL